MPKGQRQSRSREIQRIDYVKAYDNIKDIYHHEARRISDQLRQETNLTTRGIETGALRWKSNRHIISQDCAELAYHLGIGISRIVCDHVRKREDASNISRHMCARANQSALAEEAVR